MGNDYIIDDQSTEFYMCGSGWAIARSQVAAVLDSGDMVQVTLKSGEVITVRCEFGTFLHMLGRPQ